MDIASCIHELVMMNECVILRAFGGFDTTYKHAAIQKDKKIIVPPNKKIQFQPDWTKDNGVLEDHLVKTYNISKEGAAVQIDEYVKSLLEKIEKDGSVVIQGIGSFSYDENKKLIFKEKEDENFLADSFGLDILDIEDETPPVTQGSTEKEPEIIQEPVEVSKESIESEIKIEEVIEPEPTPEIKQEPVEVSKESIESEIKIEEVIKPEPIPEIKQEPVIKPEPKTEYEPEPTPIYTPPNQTYSYESSYKPAKRRYTGWYIVIGILVLFIVAAIYLISSDGSLLEKTGLVKSNSPEKDTTDIIIFGRQSQALDDTITQVIKATLDDKTSVKNALTPETGVQSHENLTFYIVAGSFQSMQNAEIMKNKLVKQGFGVEIAQAGNNYRVIIGTYNNRMQALTELRKLRSEFDQAVWMLEE